MKNASYVTLKALFVINIFKFLSKFLSHVDKQNNLIRRLISKFLTSQPGLQTIATYTYCQISQEVKAIRQ